MNWYNLIDPVLSGRLCQTLLHSIWQVALLIFAAWTIDRLRLTRSVYSSYFLHVGALIICIALLPLTYLLVDLAIPSSATMEFASTADINGNMSQTVLNLPAASPSDLRTSSPLLPPVEITTTPLELYANAAEKPPSWWFSIAPWCVALYGVGVLIMLFRVCLGVWHAHRLSVLAQPLVAGTLVKSLQRLRDQWRLHALPYLKQSEQIVVPKVVGLIRPTILFPAAALTGLTSDELEMILAHELAHISRNDVWVNLIQRLTEAVLFFNPALWYLSRRISSLREYCCDELACEAIDQNREQVNLRYAQALLHVVDLQRGAMPSNELTALAATGRSPSELRRRVARLFGEPLREPLRISRGGLAVVIGAAVLLLIPPVAQSQSSINEDKSDSSRVLTFPEGRTVGVIFSRPAEKSKFGYGANWYSDWQQVAPARGKVTVPANQHLRLDVSKSASMDLHFLQALDPVVIQYLTLKGTDVDDEQLKHVGHLVGLQMLSLEGTRVTDRGFEHLQNLKQIKNLNLSAYGVHDDGFGVGDGAMAVAAQLPALERISLRLTKVTDAGMVELAKNKSLRSIGIGGTAVTDEGLKPLLQLPNLASLRLGVYSDGAKVTDKGMEIVGQMGQLEHLDLGGTPISNEGLKHLSELKQLKSLDFEETKITEAGLAHLELLKNLESLRCYNIGGITDKGAKHLGKIKNLKRISANMRLSDAGVAELAKLQHLEQLSLSSSKVTDVSLKFIAQMPALQQLWFQDCPITDAGLALLRSSPTIDYLLISGTNVTTAGLSHLQTLPNLKILCLDITPVEGKQPDWRSLRQFKQLERLRIDGAAFSNDDFKYVEGLEQLLEIDADLELAVNDFGIAHIKSLRGLKNLRIENSEISDEGIKTLAGMDQLEYLTISCMMTDKGLQTLRSLKSLRHFQIASPYVTDDGIRELEKAVPSLQATNQFTFRLNGSTVTTSSKDAFWREGKSEDRATKDALEDKAAPPLFVENWLNTKGKAVNLAELQDKVVLVEFWGAWSGPCRRKTPVLKKLYEKYHAVGLEVVGIHTTSRSDDYEIFVKEQAIRWPVALDVDKQSASAWHVDGYPDYYLIDHTGNLRLADIADGSLEPAITALLSEIPGNASQKSKLGQMGVLLNQGASVEDPVDPLDHFLAEAATRRSARTKVLGGRFLALPVTTDLQRTLLGSVAEPDESVSLCVLVNAGAFESLDEINEQMPGYSSLTKQLRIHAMKDSRRVKFNVLDGSRMNMPFEKQKEQLAAVGEFVQKLGDEAGFASVSVSRTFGVDWDKSLRRARTAMQNINDADETVIEKENARVYQTQTFLSHFLTSANCVVDFLPIVRDVEGVRFREEVLPAVAAAVESLEPVNDENLMIRLRYSQTAYKEIDGWVEDANRGAYAKQLGFKDCFVSLSAIAESEETQGINAKNKGTADEMHSMSIRVVDANSKPVAGAKVFQNHVLHTPRGARPTTIKNQDYLTDTDGSAVIKWTGQSKDLRIWVTKPGFVPLHSMWAKDLQADGDKLPSEFKCQMETGTEIGGIVINEVGEPIEGAKVEIMNATASHPIRPNQPGRRPVPTTWLAEGDTAAITDAQGRWTAKNIPSDSKLIFHDPGIHGTLRAPNGPPIRLRISHPSYQTLDGVEFTNREQNPSIEDLRKKTASTRLRAGIPIVKVASNAGETEESDPLGTELFPLHNATAAVPADDWPKTRQDLEKRKRELLQQLSLETQFHLQDREVLKFVPPNTVLTPLKKLRLLQSDGEKRKAWMHFHAMSDDLMIVQWTYGNDRTIADIFDGILGLRLQNVKGDIDVLDQQLLGDWVFRRDPRQPHIIDPKEVAVVADAISNELKEVYQLELKTVEQPVYVATGNYKFTLASGSETKVNRIEGPVAERADGDFWVPARRRKYTGTVVHSFEDFLAVWGEVLLTPIVNEIETSPTKSDFFLRFANKPSTKLTEPLTKRTETQVLQYFTDQTGLTLKKETRPVQVLFVKKDEAK